MAKAYASAGGEAGFTLLELIIAFSLSALVLLIISAVLSFSTDIFKREESREADEIWSLLHIMEMQVGSYELGGDVSELLDEGEVIAGDESRLSVMTSYSVKSMHEGGPVLAVYSYDSAAHELVYTERPLMPGGDLSGDGFFERGEEEGEQWISARVDSFSIGYFDANGGEHRRWDGRPGELDRILITWRKNEGDGEQVMVINPAYLIFSSYL